MDSPWQRKYLASYLACFTLAIGPFFNGMFYEPVRLAGIIMVCSAFLLWQSDSRAEKGFSWGPIDWTLVAWFVSYMIVTPLAVYPRGHLSVLLDLVSVLALFFLVRRQTGHDWLFRGTLVAFGFIMVIITMLSFAGIAWFDQFFFQLHLEGRLSGGFQYPNTFAAWLFVLIMFLLPETSRPANALVALPLSGLFAGIFVMTLSRAGLVALLPAFLSLLVLTPRQNLLRVLIIQALTWIPAVYLGSRAIDLAWRGQAVTSMLVISCSTLPPLLVPYVLPLLERAVAVVSPRRVAIVLGALTIVYLTWWGPSAYNAIASPSVLTGERNIGLFSLQERNLTLRLTYYADALRLLADRNWIGAGGQAWSRLYREIQGYYYTTTEVHNHFLQTGVEAGLLGLAAFTGIWLSAFCVAWRNRPSEAEPDLIVPSLAASLGFLGAHSFMDFNLSYVSMQLLLGLILGLLTSYRNTSFPVTPSTRVWNTLLSVLCIAAITVSFPLTASRWAIQDGGRAWASGDNAAALRRFHAATVLDPLSPLPWERLGTLAEVTGIAPDGLDRKEIWSNALKRDPFWFLYYLQLSNVAADEFRLEDSVDLAYHSLMRAPMDKNLNEAFANATWRAARLSMEAGDHARTRKLALNLVRFRDEFQSRLETAARFHGLWRDPLEYTPLIHLRVGQGLVSAGHYVDGIAHLRDASTAPHTQLEALQWLYLGHTLLGEETQATQLLDTHPSIIQPFIGSVSYHVLTNR